MKYIIKIIPKFGGRAKVYPIIYETYGAALIAISKIGYSAEFNTFEVNEMCIVPFFYMK